MANGAEGGSRVVEDTSASMCRVEVAWDAKDSLRDDGLKRSEDVRQGIRRKRND